MSISARVRDLLVVAVRACLRRALWVLMRLVPTSRRVLVSGVPETEGNAVEVALALARRYSGTIVWLHEPDGVAAQVPDHPALQVVDKVGLAALWHYLRSEAVFFTHGLYGSPRPPSGRVVVNLWHGDGPKDLHPARNPGSLHASSHVVAGTRLFGEAKAAAFGCPTLLVTGNPRTDRLFRPASDEQLAELGVEGRFVLWMPTFRSTSGSSMQRAWSDGAHDVEEDDVAPLVELLHERGMQLVAKPHPMDGRTRQGPGIVVVADDDLTRAGVPLYSLLGRAGGLVTDYSSVWVDFLLLDRPMAFLVPDRDTYARALHPADVLEWLPGEVVGEQPFEEFVADLDAGGTLGRAERDQVAERIGLHRTTTAADDLLDALAAVLPVAHREQVR